MTQIAHPDLLLRWRRQVCARRRKQHDGRPRRNAGLSYRICGPAVDGFVEVENLVLVVLYDEPDQRRLPAIRFAGYSCARVPWGVKFGGRDNSRFFKDFTLSPVSQGRGLRLNIEAVELFQTAIKLDRLVQYVKSPRPSGPRLPKLWAGFRPKDGILLDGDGPELDQAARLARLSPDRLLNRLCRHYEGLVLFPFAWVSKHWEKAVTVLADLRRFPAWQVFPVNHLPADLQGFCGAAEYDFYDSRFRGAIKPPATSRRIMPPVPITV